MQVTWQKPVIQGSPHWFHPACWAQVNFVVGATSGHAGIVFDGVAAGVSSGAAVVVELLEAEAEAEADAEELLLLPLLLLLLLLLLELLLLLLLEVVVAPATANWALVLKVPVAGAMMTSESKTVCEPLVTSKEIGYPGWLEISQAAP